MKIKNVAINSILYFLYMFGACIATMVVEALLVFILSRFAVIPYPVLTVIRLVIYTLGVLALLSAIGYYEGYRDASCSVGETIAGGILALVAHFVFALLFRFQAFVAGGVRFAAGLLAHGTSITADRLAQETSYGLYIAMFILYGLLYVAALTISCYLGANRRVVNRAEMRRQEH